VTTTLNLLNLCHTPLGEESALREASSHFQGHTGLIGQVEEPGRLQSMWSLRVGHD